MTPKRGEGWWICAVWIPAAAITLLASDWLMEANFFLALILTPVMALVGLLAVLSLALTGRWKAAGVLLAAGVVLAVSPLPGWGGRLWFLISFSQHRAAYDAVVAHARELPRSGEHEGVLYRIEPGPPVRIAFPQPVGIADNWGAVVHDPSDEVATARGWRDKGETLTVRPDLQELWGGDIVSCSRITGHYYRCWFT